MFIFNVSQSIMLPISCLTIFKSTANPKATEKAELILEQQVAGRVIQCFTFPDC